MAWIKIKDIYDMVQTCRILHSRAQWKRKAIKRGAENRELRKALNRKNDQIDKLKGHSSPATKTSIISTENTDLTMDEYKKKT